MTSFTFKINGEDFTDCVNKNSYATDYKAIESKRITTLDGVDHVQVVRYRGSLTVGINPLSKTRFAQLCTALAAPNLEISYHSFQRGGDVLENMTLQSMPGAYAMTSCDTTLISAMTLSFVQK